MLGNIGRDELPAVGPAELAGLAVPLELFVAADRVVDFAGLELEVGQRRLGRGHQRDARIDFFAGFVLDQIFKRLGCLRKRASATVKLGLPELDHFVFRVLLQCIVEVLEGSGDVLPLERELSVEDVACGRFIPSLADPGDCLCRRVEIVLLHFDLEGLNQRRGIVASVLHGQQELACFLGALE